VATGPGSSPARASSRISSAIIATGASAWKRQRLIDRGFGMSRGLRLVPVDFEARQSGWEKLAAAGFDASQPAVVASTGVSMYLTHEANLATLRHIAGLAGGATLAMTFLLPLDLIDATERYFSGRTDGLRPTTGESLLVASTCTF
jgi:O-methyltransferase involved in polyketide biosynthesis